MLIPIVLVAFGADYLAPRNLVAAMIPLTALVAVIVVARRTGRIGIALAGLVALGFLAITIDVSLSPRLQRGDWRGLAAAIRTAPGSPRSRACQHCRAGRRSAGVLPAAAAQPRARSEGHVSEIDETGYAPLRAGAGEPPAPVFTSWGAATSTG